MEQQKVFYQVYSIIYFIDKLIYFNFDDKLLIFLAWKDIFDFLIIFKMKLLNTNILAFFEFILYKNVTYVHQEIFRTFS